jgi:ubiquitin-conjugating enzyme E2 variant
MGERHGMTHRSLGRTLLATAVALAAVLAACQGGLLVHTLANAPGPLPWALAAVGLALGALAADGLTGLVHWACDTWGSEDTPWLGPSLIHAFREHHRDPEAMLRHHPIDVNREPTIAAATALALACWPPATVWLADHVGVHAFLWALAVYGASANQLHYWAHAPRVPVPVRWLQRRRFVLSPEAHGRHHRAPHTGGYCISTGWLNPILDAAGFWRGLERAITRLTRAEARAADGGEALE